MPSSSIGSLAGAVRGMPGASISEGQAVLRLPIRARRRCGRTSVVSTPHDPESMHQPPAEDADPLLIACARAFRWQEQLEDGSARSVSALAKSMRLDEAYVRRQLRLTLLEPKV